MNDLPADMAKLRTSAPFRLDTCTDTSCGRVRYIRTRSIDRYRSGEAGCRRWAFRNLLKLLPYGCGGVGDLRSLGNSDVGNCQQALKASAHLISFTLAENAIGVNLIQAKNALFSIRPPPER